MYGGHAFYLEKRKKPTKYPLKVWRCAEKKGQCTARLHIIGDGTVNLRGFHNHEVKWTKEGRRIRREKEKNQEADSQQI